MNKKIKITLIVLGVIFTLCFLALQNLNYLITNFLFHPAEITVRADKIYISDGALGYESLHKEFMRLVEENPQIKTVVLGDLPGSINDDLNLKTCQYLYEKGLNTALLSNSIIESGAVDLFVSGRHLTIAKGAKIGVHSWDDNQYGSALNVPRSSPLHKTYLDLYNKVKIDTSFYWFTLRVAPPDDMHFMTEKEIQKYFGSKMASLK